MTEVERLRAERNELREIIAYVVEWCERPAEADPISPHSGRRLRSSPRGVANFIRARTESIKRRYPEAAPNPSPSGQSPSEGTGAKPLITQGGES